MPKRGNLSGKSGFRDEIEMLPGFTYSIDHDRSEIDFQSKGVLHRANLPTPEEIRSECEAIQRGWSEAERQRRAPWASGYPVEGV